MAFGEALKGEVEDFAGPITDAAFFTTDAEGHDIKKDEHVHWGNGHSGTVTKADRPDGMIEIHGDDGHDYVIPHGDIHEG